MEIPTSAQRKEIQHTHTTETPTERAICMETLGIERYSEVRDEKWKRAG